VTALEATDRTALLGLFDKALPNRGTFTSE
jgi:hypothetical protein